MPFAEDFIKGIPHEQYLLEEGGVATHLFGFKSSTGRNDNKLEQSINWNDDDQAINFTLNQTKEDGSIQFRHGVVTVPLEEIERLNNRPYIKDMISCERSFVEGNPYHGNLLIPDNVSKPTRNLVSAGLALAVSKIIHLESE